MNNIIPHIFIDREKSGYDFICVYVRDISEDVEEIKIKIPNDAWRNLSITGNESEKTCYENLRHMRFYRFDGMYKINGEWKNLIGTTFVPDIHSSEYKGDVYEAHKKISNGIRANPDCIQLEQNIVVQNIKCY
jgi:hypothetical protein